MFTGTTLPSQTKAKVYKQVRPSSKVDKGTHTHMQRHLCTNLSQLINSDHLIRKKDSQL